MTFTAEAPTRRNLLDSAIEAYFELYAHLDDSLKGRRAVRRAFERGRDQLAVAVGGSDAGVSPELAYAVRHLLESAPRANDPADAILGWLDLIPNRIAAYLAPATYELLIEERAASVQTGMAAYAGWHFVAVRTFWSTNLAPDVEGAPVRGSRELVAA